jgi:hypothetical protein
MATTAEAISAAYTRDIVMVGAFPVWLEKSELQKCFAVAHRARERQISL